MAPDRSIIRHIRTKGGDMDRRYYRTIKSVRRKSYGGTLCGAAETADDFSRDNAIGTIRIAAAMKCVGRHAEAGAMLDELCPACVGKLPKEG